MKSVALDQLNIYYSQVSHGKISITGQVFGWFMAPHPMGYYGHDSAYPGEDDNVAQLPRDAVALLPSGVDLSSFSYLVIVHSGKDQATDQYNVKSDEIWSSCECSVFPNYRTVQPVVVRAHIFTEYAILSEFNGVGTFAHEWGHLFGLPDLYDTTSGNSYVGFWSLMDSGNYCCFNSGQTTPSSIGGWAETLLGWLSPSVAESNLILSAYALKPLETPQASAVLIPVSFSRYYFVEYRENIGEDSSLQTSGILIYFVDESLDTGHGILKLVNPQNNTVFSPQEVATSLNNAVFQPNEEFSDQIDRVYITFVGTPGLISTLYSTQHLTGSYLTTNLQVPTNSPSGMFTDQVSVSGTLLTQNGAPLSGQDVELDILGTSSNQWREIATGTTDQLGEISLPVSLNLNVGTYTMRLLYPGGNVGSVWYVSSYSQLSVGVVPAKMTLTMTTASTSVGMVSVGISATGIRGQPIPNVVVTVYVDGIQVGTVRTNANGNANLPVPFGPLEVGPRSIIAKAQATNYEFAEVSGETLEIPFWMILLVIVLVGGAAALLVIYKRRNRVS